MRPLRHGGDGEQGGVGCYPHDVLRRGNEAEETEEKVLTTFPGSGFGQRNALRDWAGKKPKERRLECKVASFMSGILISL